MKNIKVKYIHPASTNMVDVNKTYDLDYVRKMCKKYNERYKEYFTPVVGEWSNYEEKKTKRTYKKKVDKED